MSFEVPTKCYLGGKWKSGKGGGQFEVINPASGEKIFHVANCTVDDVNEAIGHAKKAFPNWSKKSPMERGDVLLKIKDLLLKYKEQIGTILTKENGKPKAEAVGEVGFAASFFQWFAEEARREYGETIPSNASNKRYITIRQPAGVAALITPWNFPIGMIGRKVAAALAAGCTCVVKPAEDTPLSALLFAKVCDEAGVPPGVVNVVPCSRKAVEDIGRTLCQSKDIAVLSFTGSTQVGQQIYSQCGSSLKRLGLELGGDAPFIVFPSADLTLAIKGAMAAKFRNTGQTCVTANRIFIHESIHDKFVDLFSNAVKKELKVGDGLDPSISQGPIINKRQYDKISDLVSSAKSEGANVVVGGVPLGDLFYAPTVVTGVTPKMKIFKEEIFGPVASIIKFKNEDQVISMANDTERGLAGFFYSNDVGQCWRVAEALEVGMVGVNEGLVSTCEIPFGGIKKSGFGKEGSRYGLDEYSNLKYICFSNI